MKYLLTIMLFILILTSCIDNATRRYLAKDSSGRIMVVHEPRGSDFEHRHNIGDTVVVKINYLDIGVITNIPFKGGNASYRFKNVVIKELK